MTGTGRRVGLAALLVVGLLGCAQTPPEPGQPARVPRPAAGDRVTPEVVVATALKAGESGYCAIRFRVEGEAGPDLLRDPEVPETVFPRVTVTYYQGEQELLRTDSPRLAHCC